MNYKKLIYQFLFFSASVLALISPALINGFPLVYSDSATYIVSGFDGTVPVDRPIYYGLFLRHMSLATSAWFVVIAQAIIVWFAAIELSKRILTNHIPLVTCLVLVFLSFTTSISNYTSQLMPDIFSGVVLIVAGLLFTRQKFKLTDILLFSILLVCVGSHLSNLLVLLGLGMVFGIYYAILRKKQFFKIVAMCVLPLLLVYSVNYAYTGKFQLSRASNIFIYARMLETPAVADFLKENCHNHSYLFCDLQDNLPTNVTNFLWEDHSILYDSNCRKQNWTYCWEEKNEALGETALAILKSPVHRNILMKEYFQGFMKQLVDYKIGIMIPQPENSGTHYQLGKKLPDDLDNYCKATQFTQTLEFKSYSAVQNVLIPLSFLVLIWLLFFNTTIKKYQTMSLIMLTGLVGNAMVVSIFSTVIDRYQSRVIWVIPLLTILFIAKLIAEKQQKRN